MKANELRIGNWVHVIGKDYQVTQILEKGVNCGHIGAMYEIVNPIPLTEEWLERFGFEEIRMAIPTAYKTKDGFRIKEDDRGFWMQYKHGTTFIKYVHSLQNLYFALTGEELTIKE